MVSSYHTYCIQTLSSSLDSVGTLGPNSGRNYGFIVSLPSHSLAFTPSIIKEESRFTIHGGLLALAPLPLLLLPPPLPSETRVLQTFFSHVQPISIGTSL